jgi:predicted RNA-binding Zn-ribbon protein involved in translation (DUF1610 family)
LNINNILNKFNNNFKGSYGFDKLSKYLVIIGLVFSFSRYTSFLGLALIIYGIWRSFSKNKHKRYHELEILENFTYKFSQNLYKYKVSILQYRNYKIFKCPNCSQKLRVPRKQGHVTITCKKCGNTFKGKS